MPHPSTRPGGLTLPFTKGHGTENSFVLVDDHDGAATLSADWVRRICDPGSGIGADGVIRAVRSAALADPESQAAAAAGAMWFMDYRNADGSDAEMCGNGIRVFVQHLIYRGLLELADGESVLIGTRSGVRAVRRDGDAFAAWMGPWQLPGGEEAVARGSDTVVRARDDEDRAGLSIVVPNPHVVVELSDDGVLRALDLEVAPVLTPVPPAGSNVEFVVRHDDIAAGVGHLTMRVHERGVGETRSCGTGVCAAAIAQMLREGGPDAGAPLTWRVDVPGGTLTVRIDDEGIVELQGPAVIVADGELTGLPI